MVLLVPITQWQTQTVAQNCNCTHTIIIRACTREMSYGYWSSFSSADGDDSSNLSVTTVVLFFFLSLLLPDGRLIDPRYYIFTYVMMLMQ